MCDVPSIAVFCSEYIECFPGTASTFFLKLLVTIPVVPFITGIAVHFRFHIRCISVHILLYFNFFSASFCTTFLFADIATSISVHALSFFGERSRNCEKRPLASSCLSVCPSAWNNSAPTGRIFIWFDIAVFFENLLRKFQFHYTLTRMTGTLHPARYTFLIISRSVLLGIKNASNKSCNVPRGHHRTQFRSDIRQTARTMQATLN